ncbi:hypothetical protein D3C84_1218480 [compost metagenome]
MDAQDMKLITAVIIVFALVVPTVRYAIKEKSVSQKRAVEVINGLDERKARGIS